MPDSPDFLTPAQVAQILKVSVETVKDWSNNGKLASTRTLGGHRRFLRSTVENLRDRMEAEAS